MPQANHFTHSHHPHLPQTATADHSLSAYEAHTGAAVHKPAVVHSLSAYEPQEAAAVHSHKPLTVSNDHSSPSLSAQEPPTVASDHSISALESLTVPSENSTLSLPGKEHLISAGDHEILFRSVHESYKAQHNYEALSQERTLTVSYSLTSPLLVSPMQTDAYTSPQVSLEPDGETNSESPVVNTKRKGPPHISPVRSNIIKKPRTVTIRNGCEQLSNNQKSQLPVPVNMTYPYISLPMEVFLESKEEKEERETTQLKLFTTMVSTYALNCSLQNKNMKDFKEIYALTSCKVENLSPSKIYYMKIIDENPDHDETMRHVAEMLLEKASSRNQDNYIILVGDGKTYAYK